MRLIIALCCIALMLACDPKPEQTTSPPAPQPELKTPVEFSMDQRSTIALPGFSGRLVITIDDITAGQVNTNLSWKDGKTIVAPTSMRQDDVLAFTVNDKEYKIKLQKLNNLLIGEDSAIFRLWPVEYEKRQVLTEEQKIESLIQSLKQLEGASFIRNGKVHTPDEAIAHMKGKWKWKKSEIKTAEDFIRIIGSKSSTSGRPYIIKLPDGTEVKSGDWLAKQLKTLENKKM